jgi:hypothetical protein
MKRLIALGVVGIVTGALAVAPAAGQAPAAPTLAAKGDARFFYGTTQNGKANIRFAVDGGVAQDIWIHARGTCLYKGEKVKPYYGNRETSGIAETELDSNGAFAEHQRVNNELNGIKLPYVREITAQVGERGAEATGRITWDTIYGGRQSTKVAHCDTGNRHVELKEVSRRKYLRIVEESGYHSEIPK